MIAFETSWITRPRISSSIGVGDMYLTKASTSRCNLYALSEVEHHINLETLTSLRRCNNCPSQPGTPMVPFSVRTVLFCYRLGRPLHQTHNRTSSSCHDPPHHPPSVASLRPTRVPLPFLFDVPFRIENCLEERLPCRLPPTE